MQKKQKWNWIDRQKKAFNELKRKFTTKQVFAASDLDFKKMRMNVNISDYMIEGVLSMECEDKR